MTTAFNFSPAPFIPYRDVEAVARVRAISRANITRHSNPDLQIQVFSDAEIGYRWVADLFWRIKTASDREEQLVLILPQPAGLYRQVAHLINLFRVDCRRLHTFNMDEYANEHGETAPEDWPQGFMRAMLDNFYHRIDEDLRPPRGQVQGPRPALSTTTANASRTWAARIAATAARAGRATWLLSSPMLRSSQAASRRGNRWVHASAHSARLPLRRIASTAASA